MNKEEALRLALEALEYNDHLRGEAITAIKLSLEQERALQALHDENERLGLYKYAYGQPEPEPVAHTLSCVCGAVWDIKTDGSEEMVHTPDPSPPKRKPLTHPQIHELDWPDGVPFEDILLFARAIEAAHGIKGEA